MRNGHTHRWCGDGRPPNKAFPGLRFCIHSCVEEVDAAMQVSLTEAGVMQPKSSVSREKPVKPGAHLTGKKLFCVVLNKIKKNIT